MSAESFIFGFCLGATIGALAMVPVLRQLIRDREYWHAQAWDCLRRWRESVQKSQKHPREEGDWWKDQQ